MKVFLIVIVLTSVLSGPKELKYEMPDMATCHETIGKSIVKGSTNVVWIMFCSKEEEKKI